MGLSVHVYVGALVRRWLPPLVLACAALPLVLAASPQSEPSEESPQLR